MSIIMKVSYMIIINNITCHASESNVIFTCLYRHIHPSLYTIRTMYTLVIIVNLKLSITIILCTTHYIFYHHTGTVTHESQTMNYHFLVLTNKSERKGVIQCQVSKFWVTLHDEIKWWWSLLDQRAQMDFL